jgi:hypothetical protein
VKTLTRALGEVVIVTIGILIAFSLDAWWDGRELASREQAHLRALGSDFRENVERLSEMIEFQDGVSQSCGDLLAVARGEAADSASIRALISEVFNSNRYEPVMGAYEALVSSAGLTLISDESLRASLAQFAAQVRNDYAERFSEAQYFAFTREFAGRLRFFEDPKSVAGRPDAYADLLSDPRFQEFLTLRHASERDVAGRYRDLLEQAEAVLAQIESQPG